MQAIPRRRFLVPLVYVCVILLLVLLAVFAKSFSESLGGARISGRYSPLPLFNARALEQLTVSWNGLSLYFSRAAAPGLRTLETSGTGADIVFSGNARLRLQPEEGPGAAFTILPVSAPASGSATVLIPWSIAGTVDAAQQANEMVWSAGGRKFQLSVPAGARIDYASRSITLPLGGSASARSALELASLEPAAASYAASYAAAPFAAASSAPPAASRLPDEKSLPSADQLAAAVGRFVDAAYSGWSSSRAVPADGLWKMPNGTPGFSEELGSALLAESVERGTFSSSIRVWTDALQAWAGENPDTPPGPLTSVYTGRVRDFVKYLKAEDDATSRRIAALVARSDPSLLQTPGFERFLLTREGPGIAKAAITFLLAKAGSAIDPSDSLSLLEAVEDYVQSVGDDPSLPGRMHDLVDGAIVPAVVSADSGVFFAPSDARADLEQSIRAGSLLVRAGALLQDPRAAALGRGLIVSALSLASGPGYLPAALSLKSGHLGKTEGTLAPEAVYALLPESRWLPRAVPLFRELGAGAWVWTSADVAQLAGDDGTARLGFTYPVKVPYHLVFRGVRPFSEIRMHGIPWHADPSYATYSDGWSYDEASRTLFMKITGRADQEVVEIRF